MENKIFVLAHLDDDPLELKRFTRCLTSSHGPTVLSSRGLTAGSSFEIHSFTNSDSFLNFVTKNQRVDFCIVDIVLSAEEKKDGLSLIQQIKSSHPQCAVVVCSFNDNPAWVLKSLSLQADDFFSKQTIPENLAERLLQVHQFLQIKLGNHLESFLKNNVTTQLCAGKTLKSIEMRIQRILQSSANCILIEGESGTGKEVVADIFEHYSKNLPFVRLNSAALAQNLLESELFGHKKGAFTGALSDKVGFIEAANNGFLFLDEVFSLSETAQSALLRAIENQEIIRLGETQPRRVNVRFLCATNVSLQELVEKNKFRKDLWQRLREVDIYLPPLRERKEEIPALIDFFCTRLKERSYVIEPLAKQVLCALEWKEGNVRELRNTLRAMTEFAQNGILGINAIPSRVYKNLEPAALPQKSLTYAEHCDNLLQELIQKHIRENGKLNASQLSRELDISRTTLYEKMKNFKVLSE